MLVIIVIALALLLGGCGVMPAKHIYTEILIDAPADEIWQTLTDLDAYPSWNPYHVRVDGKLGLGEKLDLEIHKPNGDHVFISPHVMVIDPINTLTWGGGIRGIFTGEHTFALEVQAPCQTKLVHKEVFNGIAVPFASLDTIEEGYQQMNQALKTYLETGAETQANMSSCVPDTSTRKAISPP